MAYIRKRLGKFTVAIRRRYGQRIYKTFDRKSDAQSFAKETELQIQQNKFRDISETSKTSLAATKFPKNIFQTLNSNTI